MLMVINDFNIEKLIPIYSKTDTILIVDANADMMIPDLRVYVKQVFHVKIPLLVRSSSIYSPILADLRQKPLPVFPKLIFPDSGHRKHLFFRLWFHDAHMGQRLI